MFSYVLSSLYAQGLPELYVSTAMIVLLILVIACFLRQVVGLTGYNITYPIILTLLLHTYGVVIVYIILIWICASVLTKIISSYIFLLESVKYGLMITLYIALYLLSLYLVTTPSNSNLRMSPDMLVIHLLTILVVNHIIGDFFKSYLQTLLTSIHVGCIILLYTTLLHRNGLHRLTVSYPDIIIWGSIVCIIMIGRYTGLQFLEFLRFYPLISHHFYKNDEEE